MTILDEVKKELVEIIKDSNYQLDLKNLDFQVNFIDFKNNQFGDMASNVVLILASKLNQDLKVIGEEIFKKINAELIKSSNLAKLIKEVNLAKNGFLNFFLKDDFLTSELDRISKLENIETKFTKQKVLVEHSSPNLFKPFHIGHLMNNIIGESIVQMLKTTEAKLKVVSFPSDVSIGIAKAIYILKNKKGWDFQDKDIILKLGQAYVDGVKFYEEYPESQKFIKEIAKNLFEKNEESEDYQLFLQAREINIKYFQEVLGELGTHIDHFIYESEAGLRGEKIVKEDLNKPLAEQVFELGENGAVFYDTQIKKNKETNETIKSVFLNSEGHPTYEAKDLGLLELKYEYYPFEKSIFVTDAEQIPHFEVVLEVAKKLAGDLEIASKQSLHIPHGRLNLAGERMSSRLGNVLSVEEILKKVEEQTMAKMSDKTKDYDEMEKQEIIKKVSLAALKIVILKSKPGLNINFDFEQALNFDGDTGPYLLYTLARVNSIFEKVEDFKLTEIIINEENRNLILKLIQAEDVLKNGIENLAPQAIVKYLFELAQELNSFYGKVKILSANEVETKQKLSLLKTFQQIYKLTLNSLGIQEVKRM